MSRPEPEVMESRAVGYLLVVIPLVLALAGLALDVLAGRVA